ncbi:MAG TPA: succinate dehydrogenase assembly factor 2 [Steroidobacteraceae bacterium]|nr:succinate dehydrogenase assembly factor 2 [Steroidobacteraceae bacterium]
MPTNPHAIATPTTTLDQEARRLLWRCRRGMKELDVLLERFARRELPQASAGQRQTLARFLELPDPMLVDYLLGQAIPEDRELASLVAQIAGFAAANPVAAPARAAC